MGEQSKFQTYFNKLVLVLDYLRSGPFAKVDPKLFNSVVTLAVTHVVLKVGLSLDDPLVSSLVPVAVASVVGYFTENAGTAAFDGAPDEPAESVPALPASNQVADPLDTASLRDLLPTEER